MRTRQAIYAEKIRRKNKEFTAGQWITVFATVLLFAGFAGITENNLGIFVFLSLFILSPFAIVLFFKRFLRYIMSLFSKTGEISLGTRRAKTEIFKTLLRDKNFANHHNYGDSEKYQEIYKKYLYKVSIKNVVIVSTFFSLGACAS